MLRRQQVDLRAHKLEPLDLHTSLLQCLVEDSTTPINPVHLAEDDLAGLLVVFEPLEELNI